MSKKLKVGIVGIGAIGNVHAKAFVAGGQADIAAVADVDKKKVKAAADAYGVKKCFGDYDELLKTDVDAVLVCVGNAQHREVAMAALQAGKHVLLEKPMAMDATEAQEIADVAERADGILQMGMVRRQNPQAQIVREYVAKGLFGDVYHMRCVLIRRRGIPGLGGWFTTKAISGGGPMIDLGVHWFDAAMYVSGHWNPTAVSAKTYAKFGPRMSDYVHTDMWAGPPTLDGTCDVEDYSAGFVRFGDKATLSFEIVWAANAKDEGYVEILGSKGGAKFFCDELCICTEQERRVVDVRPQYPANFNIFELQAQTFISACRGEAEPAATAGQGVTVMKLIDAIYASSEANAEVKIS